MIICIGFLLAHVRSRDGAQDQENAPMSQDPFPCERLGSGNETNQPAEARSVGRSTFQAAYLLSSLYLSVFLLFGCPYR